MTAGRRLSQLWRGEPQASTAALVWGLAAVLSAAAAGGAWWADAQTQRLASLREDLATRRQQIARAARSSSAEAADASSLVAALPADAVRQSRLQALLALSREFGLSWPRAELGHQLDAALGVSSDRVSLQLSGPYSSVRAYVAEALQRDAGLALLRVQIRRETPPSQGVQAELSWVLHSRGAP